MRSRRQNPLSIVTKQQLHRRQYWGLCMNCTNRSTCTFPRVKGGVLYCDEYD